MKSGRDHDPFLGELEASVQPAAALDWGLTRLAERLPVASPDANRRALVLAELDPYDRFARFEAAVAALLQLSPGEAAQCLRRIDDASAWQQQAPGISYLPVAGGTGSEFFLSGFLRVEAGLEFPEHEHLGDEVTLVLQGTLFDNHSRRVFRPGEPSHMPPGSRHSFRVPADGVHLVGLVTVKTGVRLVLPEPPP